LDAALEADVLISCNNLLRLDQSGLISGSVEAALLKKLLKVLDVRDEHRDGSLVKCKSHVGQGESELMKKG